MRNLIALIAVLMVSCGSLSQSAQGAPSKPAAPSASAVPVSAPTPTPTPSATPIAVALTPLPPAPTDPPAQAADLTVAFQGLPPGTYPVHLHSICNGRQGFHLAYLPNLYVSAMSTGRISVPAMDFGHGWCVVVYANRALTAVAGYRTI
jgi:hypothetical protein